MRTFCILHLSDLHISDIEVPISTRMRDSLLDDISKMLNMHSISIDAVAMTGDSVDRGGTETAFQMAENYYSLMADRFGLPRENIVIIPGNHDIPRRHGVKLLIDNNKDDFNDEEKFSEHWETFEPRFKRFNKLKENVSTVKNDSSENFGACIQILESDKGSIKFYLLNSAWACTGENDFGNTLIGIHQLESLKKRNESSFVADLTIGLMHHPLEWLEKSDRQNVMNFLTDQKCLPVDLILHGHIHDGVVETLVNPDRKITSLVTGMGYPDREANGINKNKVSGCRYSIYNFNVDNGNVDIILRKSNVNGIFYADTNLYSAGGENGCFTINYKNIAKVEQSSSLNIVTQDKFELDDVPSVPEWVGRNNELSILEDRTISVIAITGIWGQGKSALASEFLRKYVDGTNAKYDRGIWVDCRELEYTLHYKIIQALEVLTGGTESAVLYREEKLASTIKRLVKHLKTKKILLRFDNIDAYVKAENEGPTDEFRPIFDALLEIGFQSLVIITCRPSLVHSSSSFQQLQLSGLDKKYAVDYFSKRNITISKQNSVEDCQKIFELTQGHLWWLGLIAGQVSTGRDNLKKIVVKFNMGDVPFREQIQVYFKSIWKDLNKLKKSIIRYLVESHRPLTQDEINLALLDSIPSQIAKELSKLNNLGLIDLHESKFESSSLSSYQVHPLAREFIHETYTTTDQEKYVQRILCIHMDKRDVDLLFNDIPNLNETLTFEPDNLVDSIETCFNSRNIEKALNLLEVYGFILQDGGQHHQYKYLACRVLDSLNWSDNRIVKASYGNSFFRSLLQQLSYEADIYKCRYYLKKYESLTDMNSAGYLYYLALASDISWRIGDFSIAIDLSYQYEELAGKLLTTEGILDVKHSRALSLRDIGKYEEALKLFDEVKSNDPGEVDTIGMAIYFGNRASCLIKLTEYESAKVLLRKCLFILTNHTSYLSLSNIGYAYLWLSDIFFKQESFNESKAFIMLAHDVWTEYAPGLLSKIDDIYEMYKQDCNWNEIDMTRESARNILELFLLAV
jgi:predicted MPP superfamily phosphohydrolase/tetratricopeptide (TPR) repeat protein